MPATTTVLQLACVVSGVQASSWATLRSDNNVYSRVNSDPAVYALGTFDSIEGCEKAAGPPQPEARVRCDAACVRVLVCPCVDTRSLQLQQPQ